MAFYGYQGDVGECHWPPYSSTAYDYNDSYHCYPNQASMSYSSYEFGNPNLIENSPNYYSYHDYSGYYARQPEVNHSVYYSSEPKLIQYDGGYAFSETKYIVSYSTIEHDDTDFDEYDPDPYSGGYDIAQTYGKPLPPSDQTCYPRSAPVSNGLDLEGFSYGSTPSPYGKDNDQPVKPSNETEQVIAKDRDIVTGDVGKSEDLNKGNGNSSHNHEKENGRVREYDYGYGDYQVTNIPYGAGLESVDICDSIFGYWPCWEKYKKGNANYQLSDQESGSNPWKSTADYLFGSPFGYGEDHPRDERFGDFSYGSYYQQQRQYIKEW